MKILDVSKLNSSIEQTIAEIRNIQNKLTNVLSSVNSMVSLEDNLTGAVGDSIRAYFTEIHLPFIKYFFDFLEEYKQTLNNVKLSVNNFESDDHGFIRQSFLENEVESGLENVKQLAIGLSNEANTTISKVTDIVSLPKLNPSDFVTTVEEGKRKLNEIISDLHELDQLQSKNLSEIQQELNTMTSYIQDLQSNMQNGKLLINNYDPTVIQSSPSYQKVIEKIAEKEEKFTIDFELEAAFDGKGEQFAVTAEAVAFYQVYNKVRKGFKIEKIVKSNNRVQYRLYKPELIGVSPPKNGRKSKIYWEDDLKAKARQGNPPKVSSYIRPGASAVSALKSKAGWIGIGITTVENVIDNVNSGKDATRIIGDAAVDVGIGVGTLVVGGVVAGVAGTLGAPVIVGAGVAAAVSVGVSVLFESVKINGKSISNHIKDAVNSVANSAKNAVSTVAGWLGL